MEHNGILFYPSSPLQTGYHYTAYLRPFNFGYWCLFNVLKFPVCQVPLGLSKNGLPIGIQVRKLFLNLNIRHLIKQKKFQEIIVQVKLR